MKKENQFYTDTPLQIPGGQQHRLIPSTSGLEKVEKNVQCFTINNEKKNWYILNYGNLGIILFRSSLIQNLYRQSIILRA